jgi:hypothetical protein
LISILILICVGFPVARRAFPSNSAGIADSHGGSDTQAFSVGIGRRTRSTATPARRWWQLAATPNYIGAGAPVTAPDTNRKMIPDLARHPSFHAA